MENSMGHQTDSLTASPKDHCSVHQKGYQKEHRTETHWEPHWAPWKGHCSVHQKDYPKDYQLEADWVKPKAHQTVAMTVPQSVHLTGCYVGHLRDYWTESRRDQLSAAHWVHRTAAPRDGY